MGIIAALIIAVILTGVFSSRYRGGTSVLPLVIFFFILFLAALTGQYWVSPFGPVVWGVAWVPIILITIIFAFLLTAVDSRKKKKYFPTKGELKQEETVAAVTIGVFTWIVLVALLIAAITGYYRTYLVV